jgi:hypothetical protein
VRDIKRAAVTQSSYKRSHLERSDQRVTLANGKVGGIELAAVGDVPPLRTAETVSLRADPGPSQKCQSSGAVEQVRPIW